MIVVACSEADRGRLEQLLQPWSGTVLTFSSRTELFHLEADVSGAILVFSRLTWGSSSVRLLMLEAVEKVAIIEKVWLLGLGDHSVLDIFPEYRGKRVLKASELSVVFAERGGKET